MLQEIILHADTSETSMGRLGHTEGTVDSIRSVTEEEKFSIADI